jgi:hypothetical protein
VWGRLLKGPLAHHGFAWPCITSAAASKVERGCRAQQRRGGLGKTGTRENGLWEDFVSLCYHKVTRGVASAHVKV